MILHIDEPDDERLADYRNVPDPELLHRLGAFVAEGRLVVRRLLTASRFRARSVMVTRAGLAALDGVPLDPDLPVFVVPQAVMNGITGFNLHRGCLAIGERAPQEDWRDIARRSQLLVVLEAVANADNVGSIFRNAAAFGADGVLLGPSCADPLYRKAIRTSMGAAVTLPFAAVPPWPEALDDLKELGFRCIALTPDPEAPALHDVARATGAARALLVVGHEGEGLRAATVARCGDRARIPMAPGVDSLNVATAAAVALYEMSRARAAAAASPACERAR